jgi:hypothetical protein
MNDDRSLLLTLALPLFVAPLAACDRDKGDGGDTDTDVFVDTEVVDTEIVDTEVPDTDVPECGDGVVEPDMVCFGSPASYSAEGSAEAVLFADFDDDGDADLVFSSYGSVYWTAGVGDGTFGGGGGQVSIGGTTDPVTDLERGDLDGDGDDDVVIASAASAALVVLGDGGEGGLQQEVYGGGEGHAVDVFVADIVGTPSSDDLIQSDVYCGGVAVTAGPGGESLVATTLSLCSPSFVALARTSIAHTSAVTTEGQDVKLTPLTYGEGALTAGDVATVTLAGTPRRLVVADLDGDGFDDAAVLVAGEVDVLLGDGADGWAPQGADDYATYTSTDGATDLAAGDVDGDGDVDLAIVDPAHDGVGFLLNDGHGSFTPAAVELEAGAAPDRITLGDVNGDGWLDIGLTTEEPDVLTVLLADP